MDGELEVKTVVSGQGTITPAPEVKEPEHGEHA